MHCANARKAVVDKWSFGSLSKPRDAQLLHDAAPYRLCDVFKGRGARRSLAAAAAASGRKLHTNR